MRLVEESAHNFAANLWSDRLCSRIIVTEQSRMRLASLFNSELKLELGVARLPLTVAKDNKWHCFLQGDQT